MEVVDNAIIVVIPGAMDAGLGDILFWGGAVLLPIRRRLRRLPGEPVAAPARQGHTAVHETGIHGGPDPKVVGTIAVIAGVFGMVVLLAEAL